MREIVGIQVLRGLAASAVLLFHTGERFQFDLKFGAAGVDVFFVISGFIMWLTTFDRAISPQTFMVHRIRRIVPLYWCATLAVFALMQLKPNFFPGHDGSLEILVRSLLFAPVLTEGEPKPVLEVGWTLYLELFFYLIFAACLLARREFRPALLAVIFTMLALLHPYLPTGMLSFLTQPIILEFIGGVLLGWLWTSGYAPSVAFGAVMLAVGCVAIPFGSVETRLVTWGIPSMLIVSGALGLEPLARKLSKTVFELAGNASYSIYLFHLIFIILIDGALLRMTSSEVIRMSVVLPGALLGCVAVYWFLEKPLSRRRWKFS